ncbi:hypothetical protein Tco_0645866 [Tanacetum coccineum]
MIVCTCQMYTSQASMSFATLLKGDTSRKSLNIRTLITPAGNEADVVIPLESIRVFSSKDGLDAMLESGHWLIHNNPLILRNWDQFPEEFLCWVDISRNYLLNKDTYPRFEYEDGEGMDLNAFIRTADPRKHRTVTLLPTLISRPSRELSESIEREFGEDGSGGEVMEDASVCLS